MLSIVVLRKEIHTKKWTSESVNCKQCISYKKKGILHYPHVQYKIHNLREALIALFQLYFRFTAQFGTLGQGC